MKMTRYRDMKIRNEKINMHAAKMVKSQRKPVYINKPSNKCFCRTIYPLFAER